MSIKSKFSLCAILTYTLGAVLTKVLSLLKVISATDVMISDSNNFFIKNLPNISGYASDFFRSFLIAACVAALVYAVMYFGNRTAMRLAFVFIGISLICSAGIFIFGICYNSYETAQTIAYGLTGLIDWLYSVFTAMGVLFVATTVARFKRTGYTPLLPSLLGILLVFIVNILDLTLANVIPFLVEYSDITNTEILTIIKDYSFYAVVYLVLPSLLCFAILAVLKKVTGRLKLKLRHDTTVNQKGNQK